jgi:chemotaxis protein histidine kinase CheA
MNTSADIVITSSSISSIKNQSVGDGVDTLIELLSTATAEQIATILAILHRGPNPAETTVSAEKPEKLSKSSKTSSSAKPAKTAKISMSLPSATEGAPTADSYRLNAVDVDSSVCVGRILKGGDDKRWKPIIYRESQCGSPLAPGSDLCSKCSKRAEKYATESKTGDWNGRVTEEPQGWVHMLGTEWALGKKPRFMSASSASSASSAASEDAEEHEMSQHPSATDAEDASDSESESVSSQTEMPATSASASASASAPVSDKKAAAAAAKAQKLAAATAAKEAKIAEKEAEKAKKLADKEAAAAKKLADKEAAVAAKKAEKAAKPVKKAEAKVSATSASAPASNSAASEVTEVTEVTGELKLIDGTLYMVKTGNVYEYDELSEKAGDFVGRLTTDETIDTEADEVAAVESDSE